MQGREDAKYLRRERTASIGGGARGEGSQGEEGVIAIACGVVSVAIGVREVSRRLRLGGGRTLNTSGGRTEGSWVGDVEEAPGRGSGDSFWSPEDVEA